MAINPDIRDQAYQFFVEESPELLQVLEAGLLTLRQERSTAKVHDLMRAAHSIKGGASSVGLDAIATIAHRLETVFKALYSDALDLDADLENQLFQAFDCLRLPLVEQIATGTFDSAAALVIAEPIFSQLEERCGDALIHADSYLPSSADLGVDMVSAIFEVDVAQGLERLATIVSHPQEYEVLGELRAQVEVFEGFAEFLNLPGFGAIAKTVQRALKAHPDRALEITQLALADFECSRQMVLNGDRTQEMSPSATLVALADTEPANPFDQVIPHGIQPVSEIAETTEDAAIALSLLQDAFGGSSRVVESSHLETESLEALDADSSPTLPNDPASNAAEQDLARSQVGRLVRLNPKKTSGTLQIHQSAELSPTEPRQTNQTSGYSQQIESPATPNLTVRVDADRLERMNNLVGELAINRDGLSLQSDQLQGSLRELLNRFSRFQKIVHHLGKLSDHMLIAPERSDPDNSTFTATPDPVLPSFASAEFDPLEMDHYGALQSQVQEILESLMQMEETIEDITLFSKQPHQMLAQQRRMLSQLRDEVMQARMLPLGEVLNRFHRILRDLSTIYQKPVRLTLTGAEVLIEKAILEKLYDPLLHLLRNAFDHGIEPSEIRQQRGKPEEGQIAIRAYHQGNQTIIEVKDDGQGLNLERIQRRALELGWLSSEQLVVTPSHRLYELIFEPGFSTAPQISNLSGRGVGLDVVRSQLRSIKGTVTVASSSEQGTTFTLRLPLTLTIANLVICLMGTIAIALLTDSVEEIVTPKIGDIRQSGAQQFLYWHEKIIPVYRLANLLSYRCPLPDAPLGKSFATVPSPKNWAPPVLIFRQEQQIFALEVDKLVTEQELVIKPFSTALTPPAYAYGCTILGDGSLVPVIDGAALLSLNQEESNPTMSAWHNSEGITLIDHAESLPALRNQDSSVDQHSTVIKTAQTPTVLVVDDAVSLRRTLALTLKRSGFRVLQAQNGWEAIDQLQQNSSVQLVICDIEMPNMNGFEFLNYRRQDPQLSKIPIVILTSRSNEKHRWLAMQLGATAYFTKPYLEQELLAALKQFVD